MLINPIFQRLALLTGANVMEALSKTNVIIFGVGGVGSWCAEALVRSGIGKITIVDADVVCATNLNRQLQATQATIGEIKVVSLKKRLLEINPECCITIFEKIFCKETCQEFGIENADYVIDAIDSLIHKVELIEYAYQNSKTIFSSMGMAQKLDPTQIKIGDIWETKSCPLARIVRQELRKRNFTGNFKTVYSEESIPNDKDLYNMYPETTHNLFNKTINGSAVTVTATAGMILASLVIQDMYHKHKKE